MAFIVTRLTENQLQLAREEVVRKLPWGTNWRFMRLAALVSINANGPWTPGTDLPPWFLGACTGGLGVQAPSSSAVDIIGVGHPIQTEWGNQWLFTNTTQFNQLNIQTFSHGGWAQKLGSTWTTNNQAQIGMWWACQSYNSTPFHTAIMIDILKGTLANSNPASYTFNFWYPAGLQVADLPKDTFFNQIQNPQSMPNMSVTGFAATLSGNFLHDYVCFSWTRAVPSLNLAELCVIRFA